MVENEGRVRVPLEDRIPPGEQAGYCIFPMGKDHLCPNPVFVKHVLGSKPRYCEQVVDGIRHTGKNAAIARDRLGISTADVKRLAAEREVATGASQPPVRRERPLSPVPSLPFESAAAETEEQQLHQQLSASISQVQAASSSKVQQSDARTETGDEQQLLVSEAVDRVQALVAKFDSAAQVIAYASEVLAPQIAAALESAAGAGAAEREIIEVNRSTGEKIVRAETARRVAEEATAEHRAARQKMAVERDTALAEAKTAKEEAAAAITQAKADVEQARKDAEQAKDEATAAIDHVLQQASETERAAEEKVAAATAARTRAQGEAEALGKQVKQLTEQLASERAERREDAARRDEKAEAREEQHRREIKELHDYYQGIVKNTQDLLREAYALTGRQPADGAETTAADAE